MHLAANVIKLGSDGIDDIVKRVSYITAATNIKYYRYNVQKFTLHMHTKIVPKKCKQINDYLFIDTYKSNKIKVGVNDMMVNDSKMCAR